MPTTLDDAKAELLSRLCDYASQRTENGVPGDVPGDVPGAARAYYRHAAPEDLLDRSEADLYGAVLHHLETGTVRDQGTATVRIFTPNAEADGWTAEGRTVVEVVFQMKACAPKRKKIGSATAGLVVSASPRWVSVSRTRPGRGAVTTS